MKAYFCEKTGVRIVAPGVCKAVDPIKGQDEFNEAEGAPEPAKPETTKPSEGSGGKAK
jgi:hypothetical protein